MLIDYPLEWEKYMIIGNGRTFSKNTPAEIIEKAKKINEKALKYAGKPFFYFENDDKKNI